MQITTIGLDIAKNVFQVHGIDAAEKVIVRKQLRRGQMLAFFKALPPCLVGMEACATSHYWARELTKLGHQVRLMPAKDVKAYVKRNKNDAADAQAICEAVRRPSFGHIEVTDGRVWLKQSGVAHFAGDLPEAEQKLIYATQGAPVADLFNQKVDGTAWKSKPSWYVLAREDQTVHPELQRSVSKRMKATTTEVTASHVPMLSKPDVVLDVIRKAASAVSAS